MEPINTRVKKERNLPGDWVLTPATMPSSPILADILPHSARWQTPAESETRWQTPAGSETPGECHSPSPLPRSGVDSGYRTGSSLGSAVVEDFV